MTVPLFRDDAYLTTAEATVTVLGDGWVGLDRSLFYAAGGGQPGDTGRLELDDGTMLVVTDARYGEDRVAIRLSLGATAGDAAGGGPASTAHGDQAPAAFPSASAGGAAAAGPVETFPSASAGGTADGADAGGGADIVRQADDGPRRLGRMPRPGETVVQHLDWGRRYRLMRMHTALHLLSVALPYPVTGGQIGEAEGRLDFDIPDASPDRDAIAAAVQAMVDADHLVTTEWITDAELDASPELVKTMAVKPPRGSGRVRLVRIGSIDLQPCGGTHVASTAEIGRVAITRIEKKGKLNRRVRLELLD